MDKNRHTLLHFYFWTFKSTESYEKNPQNKESFYKHRHNDDTKDIKQTNFPSFSKIMYYYHPIPRKHKIHFNFSSVTQLNHSFKSNS